MPTYPSLPIDPRDSKRVPRDGRREDDMGDGAVRVRKLHATRSDFEVHHRLSTAQLTTLKTFETSNETTVFDFVWPEDGLTYQVRFGEGGVRTKFISSAWRDAWVRLVSAGT